MSTFAEQVLKAVLDKCRATHFSEIRFVSGMCPAFVDKDGPHLLEVAQLSQELVIEINELCYSLSDESGTGKVGVCTYSFDLRQFGRLKCHYEQEGNVARLVLVRDDDGAEAIEFAMNRKPPSLGAAANPGKRKKRN